MVEIHPNITTKHGIEEGETVVVEARRGSIKIEARATEDILPGVVNIPHGWDEASVNILTGETPADTIVGNPALKALLCKSWKKAQPVMDEKGRQYPERKG